MQPVLKSVSLDKSQPLQQQLYVALTRLILEAQLEAGVHMPSSRRLAEDMQVSRNTVVAVYEQMKAEGFLVAEPGRGFFVSPSIRSEERRSWSAHNQSIVSCEAGQKGADGKQTAKKSLRASASLNEGNLPFTPGLPDLQAFPIKQWNRIAHHHESRLSLLGYDNIQGYTPLCEAIADYVRTSRGVRCNADQVIITCGAQQALALMCDVLLDAKDEVLIENPGYRGAKRVLQRHDIQLHAVPLHNNVLNVDALAKFSKAKLVYCTPTHQYPMGGSLNIAERLQLVRWAKAAGAWVLEDDYDSEFQFASRPFAAVQGLMDDAPVVYIGSFSKTLMPALRMGYMIVPSQLVEPVLRRKHIVSGESPTLAQAVVAEFMQTGQFNRHVRRMRQLYKSKWQYMVNAIETRLSDRLNIVAESAGMHLVVTFAQDDMPLVQHLKKQGFGSASLSDHFVSENIQENQFSKQNGLVLGFASASEKQIDQCVAVLDAVLN
ncbi:HTH-type transcriptional regulatory protein GabR [Thalassocella blandensis]|nr:HTH-type transcriptional regulatory protein GabR [Thalassocella blandensis]